MEPVRILVVDDFEPWRRAVCSILAEDADLEVVSEGSDGLEAVRKSEQLQPDLVLLDIQLPVKNGWEVMEELKRDPHTRSIPVHIISSFEVKNESIRKSLRSFAAVARRKPYSEQNIDRAPLRSPRTIA